MGNQRLNWVYTDSSERSMHEYTKKGVDDKRSGQNQGL